MNNTIFLTASEKESFILLPANLQEGWTIQDETLTQYESARQLTMRYHLADFKFHPEIKTLADRIMNGESPDIIDIEKLDPEVLKEVFFVLGAKGVNAMMTTLMPRITNDKDIELLATLSTMRHKLLELNSSATHV